VRFPQGVRDSGAAAAASAVSSFASRAGSTSPALSRVFDACLGYAKAKTTDRQSYAYRQCLGTLLKQSKYAIYNIEKQDRSARTFSPHERLV
jgi:hypothetical protein